MKKQGPKIVVLGFMGACPIAGVLWQHLHYLESLRRLGCDVWYLEDTARFPYNPEAFDVAADYHYAAGAIAQVMDGIGLGNRWGYVARHLDPVETVGLSHPQIQALLREADAALNICGSHLIHDALAKSRCLIYVESDPGVEQIKVANGDETTRNHLAAHHHLFTFGEWVPTPHFPVPLEGLTWLPTRQPVVTDLWQSHPPESAASYSTIANWSTSGQKDIRWQGETYLWSKSLEFLKYQSVPALAGVQVEMATDIPDPAVADAFGAHGWHLTLPHRLSIGTDDYRSYIQRSRGEFTVAKDQYVRLRTGWFSDRSACYLAAGRPVITQETGFSEVFGQPDGGVIGYSTIEEAVEALRRVEADYPAHARQAKEVAREWFEGEKVMKSLLERAGLW